MSGCSTDGCLSYGDFQNSKLFKSYLAKYDSKTKNVSPI